MATTVTALAPAKINLTFDILGTLPDGYHQVDTLLQSIDLYDELTFCFAEAPELTISLFCAGTLASAAFPVDDTNLISKAARLFFREAKPRLGDGIHKFARMDVAVAKNIPVGAGLAGGSSNAAATLCALNKVYGQPFTTAELLGLARSLGADVPFCLAGGTAIGTHRGDILQPVEFDQSVTLFFCVVKPIRESVSTPWAYAEYDKYKGSVMHPDLPGAVKALKAADLEQAIASFGNVFEPVIFRHLPQLAQLKERMLNLGAWSCQLSGSGPALYALAADREHAHFLRRKLLKNDEAGFEYGSSYSSYEFGPPIEFHIAQSIPHGVQAHVLQASR